MQADRREAPVMHLPGGAFASKKGRKAMASAVHRIDCFEITALLTVLFELFDHDFAWVDG